MIPSFIARNWSRCSSGRPMSFRNTVQGIGTASSSCRSQVPLACELVDDAVEELGHLVLERSHRPRSEKGVEDPPVLDVLRGVHLERDERPGVAELDRFGPRREHHRGYAARTRCARGG